MKIALLIFSLQRFNIMITYDSNQYLYLNVGVANTKLVMKRLYCKAIIFANTITKNKTPQEYTSKTKQKRKRKTKQKFEDIS